MRKVKYFEVRVWNQRAEFKTMAEARKYVRDILSIYHDSGINTALIRWEIKPIYK